MVLIFCIRLLELLDDFWFFSLRFGLILPHVFEGMVPRSASQFWIFIVLMLYVIRNGDVNRGFRV